MELTPAQRYYQNHKEARRAYGRDYYAKNKDRILAAVHARKAAAVQAREPEPEEEVVEEEDEPVLEHIADPIAMYKRRGVLAIEARRLEFK
jgi:hypothetical protein